MKDPQMTIGDMKFRFCVICGICGFVLAGLRAEQPMLTVPQAVILKADQPENDLNLRAYGQVFDSVAIARQTVTSLPEQAAGGLVLVVPARSARALQPEQVKQALQLVERGALLVTEEITPLSEKLGFRAGPLAEVTQIEEVAYPEVMIVWQRPGGVTALQAPAAATVLTREKWSGQALAAIVSHGRGHALLLATELDPVLGEGYARFPYFVHGLRKAGLTLPFRSERLSAFFDSAYRLQVDLNYFARKWRQAGINALHVSAWHFYERDPERDDYLKRLIAVCHRNGILVYAWLELPHVSEAFWQKHPQWREKTAIGQDARLDWRYLMNLKDPECFRAVAEGESALLQHFDWDGVNLSEMYFESPRGPQDPERFTPLNTVVRAEFKARHGIDPLEFFQDHSPHFWKKDAGGWKKFVDYRVQEVRLLHERFLQMFSELRSGKPGLGLAVTFVDNQYDPKMREAIGADVKEILPLLSKYDFTLIMEDPGTVWHLGPRRYLDLAQTYGRLTRETARLGIDINVVERWQDVYPTKKQTGGEFLELFHYAGANFRTVLVYFEKSISNQDLEVAANALAANVSAEAAGDSVRVTTSAPVVFQTGLAGAEFQVDGNAWPCASGGEVLLPAGEHRVAASAAAGSRPHLIRLNGELQEARYSREDAIEFSYRARPRAIALFDRAFKTVEVDDQPLPGSPAEFVMLPGGSHRVRVSF